MVIAFVASEMRGLQNTSAKHRSMRDQVFEGQERCPDVPPGSPIAGGWIVRLLVKSRGIVARGGA
jgi:hypothetical protein